MYHNYLCFICQVLRILKWCVTFLWLENQPSYVVKKFFEAVTVLGDNLLFSIMTFRLKTLSIRSNIILAYKYLRLSDFKLCQSGLKSFQHFGEGVEVFCMY